jgi:hypothetical protein
MRGGKYIMQICKVELRLISKTTLQLPEFAGSTIRGAFGNILRETVCVQPNTKCQHCMLRNHCAYTYLFEGRWYFSSSTQPQSGVPQPFVFEPPIDGQTRSQGNEIQLGLLLYGDAINYLPYFTYCFERLGQWGLGRNRSRYGLDSVRDVFNDYMPITKGNTGEIMKKPQTRIWDDYLSRAVEIGTITRCQIELLTPLRVKQGGQLQNQFNFDLLIRAIIRRWNLLCKYYSYEDYKSIELTELLNLAKTIPSGTLNLQWEERKRYSRRQGQRMMMGGMMGIMECEGELESFLPWLLLGEDLHVGKNTSFGLGKYMVKYE